MIPLAGILLILLTVAWVLTPLTRGIAAPLKDGPDRVAELRECYALRDVAYETIRDIEFDFHAGKIDEDDYRELNERHRREAMQLVGRIEAIETRIQTDSRGRQDDA